MLIKIIASDIKLPADFINMVAITANHRYKLYKIKKRTQGFRVIEHPSRELKLLQRWLVDNIFTHLPVHDSVFSYRKGRSVKDNAKMHIKNNYLLRIDFSDFFPSIHAADIANLLITTKDNLPYNLSKRDTTFITSIVCKDRHLTIGAPSSPAISNAILYDFDRKLHELAKSNAAAYTRYADDLYFSTNEPDVLENILETIKTEIKNMKHPKLSINHNKSVFTSRKRQRKVTGITLTSDKKLSVGRHRKRLIKSLVYSYINGKLSHREASHLRGLISYVGSIEPNFITSLEKKYSINTINKIRNVKLPSRK